MSDNQDDQSFEMFFAVLAHLNGWDHIPKFHFKVLEFLTNDKAWVNNIAVMQLFRNASKSTIAAAWIVWKLVKDPTLLILIQSADDKTAMKMVADVKRIIGIHPMAVHLRGNKNQWTARQITVAGNTSGRNSSVEARGIFSNVTGSRADIIVYDDVEVPRNAANDEMREKLRARISESHHLLQPGGLKLFIGTPHAYDSIYPEFVGKGASSLTIPLLSTVQGEFPKLRGNIVWAERWDQEEIYRKQQACKSRAEFYSQYQLIPMAVDESVLDPSLLLTYEDEPVTHTANKTTVMMLNGVRIRAVVAFWDVAVNTKRGDNSVLAIVYLSQDGHLYIHRTIELLGGIEQQCLQVKKAALEFALPIIYVETNGVGAMVPQLLLKEVRGLGIGVDGVHTTYKKSDKIIEAFETPLSAQILYVHTSVMSTKFMTQFRDFNPARMAGHDDFIDAPASAIKKLPIVVGAGQMNEVKGFQSWRPHGECPEMALDSVKFG